METAPTVSLDISVQEFKDKKRKWIQERYERELSELGDEPAKVQVEPNSSTSTASNDGLYKKSYRFPILRDPKYKVTDAKIRDMVKTYWNDNGNAFQSKDILEYLDPAFTKENKIKWRQAISMSLAYFVDKGELTDSDAGIGRAKTYKRKD